MSEQTKVSCKPYCLYNPTCAGCLRANNEVAAPGAVLYVACPRHGVMGATKDSNCGCPEVAALFAENLPNAAPAKQAPLPDGLLVADLPPDHPYARDPDLDHLPAIVAGFYATDPPPRNTSRRR